MPALAQAQVVLRCALQERQFGGKSLREHLVGPALKANGNLAHPLAGASVGGHGVRGDAMRAERGRGSPETDSHASPGPQVCTKCASAACTCAHDDDRGLLRCVWEPPSSPLRATGAFARVGGGAGGLMRSVWEDPAVTTRRAMAHWELLAASLVEFQHDLRIVW